MDEHIHKSITTGLRQRGVDVLTIQEDDRTGTPDRIILDRATELGRVIFTQDDDFLAIAHQYQTKGIYFSGVIYAHQQNVTVGDCIRDGVIVFKISNLLKMR
jgi:predicted nuclease of predicted toxin-antitoxin system